MSEQTLHLDGPAKERLIDRIRQLPTGKYRVKIVKHLDRRSLQANAYYWGVVLPNVAAGLLEAWGETLTVDEAHEYLKIRFLRRPIVDRNTGDLKGYTIPTTPKLDTKEFSDYLEKIFEFAASMLGVVIPEADSFRENAPTVQRVAHRRTDAPPLSSDGLRIDADSSVPVGV